MGRWLVLQQEAKEFLSAIGNDVDIMKLMGPRYDDVKKALEGVQSFSLHATPSVQSTLTSNSSNLVSARASASTTPQVSVVAESSTKMAGRKRNNQGTPIILDVIDLTEED
jgi:hypothetical protein